MEQTIINNISKQTRSVEDEKALRGLTEKAARLEEEKQRIMEQARSLQTEINQLLLEPRIASNLRVNIHKGVCEHLSAMYAEKNQGYGSSYRKTRDKFNNALLIQLNDKLSRLESLYAAGAEEASGETAEDTLLDLANYCIMEVVERTIDKREAERRTFDAYR